MKRLLLTIGAVLVAAGIFAGGYFTARKHYRNPYDDYLPPFADLNVYNVKTAEDYPNLLQKDGHGEGLGHIVVHIQTKAP